jgi:hypothetical protein
MQILRSKGVLQTSEGQLARWGEAAVCLGRLLTVVSSYPLTLGRAITIRSAMERSRELPAKLTPFQD